MSVAPITVDVCLPPLLHMLPPGLLDLVSGLREDAPVPLAVPLFLAGRGTVLSKLNLFVPGDTLNLPCLSFLTWGPSWDTSVLLSALVWFPDHPCI